MEWHKSVVTGVHQWHEELVPNKFFLVPSDKFYGIFRSKFTASTYMAPLDIYVMCGSLVLGTGRIYWHV